MVMDDRMNARVFLLLLAARMVGDYLYSWGGEEADEGGFDCSGFVSVALMQAARAWPALYAGGRAPARGIYAYYDARGCPDITNVDDLLPGDLVFYRRPGKAIHHIAIHAANVPTLTADNGPLDVGPIAFESGGGGSSTTSPREALCRSAGVRLTASDQHGAGVEWVAKDPFILLD
jgi:cell wall-associated NlpC family hydrolase